MYGAKEQRASTDTASLRSMARLSAYAKVADGAERPPSVVAAGVLISDSVSGVERLQPLVEASSQRAFRLQLLLEGPAQGAAVALLLLTFWEIPRWCRADGRCECVWDVDDPSRCPYPTFDISYVDEYVAVAAQVACAGVVAAHLACNAVAVGRARFFGPGGAGWVAAAALLLVLDIARAWLVVLGARGLEFTTWRVAPHLRLLLFVGYSGETRSQLRLIFRILPAYLRVGALVSLLLVFFGWFGVVLFPPRSSAQGEAYFTNLWQTCWQLFICITTANFPDVMIPAYSHARLPAAVYFGGFLVLGFFFMMNLLLATVYNAYTDERESASRRRARSRAANITAAFELLAAGETREVSRGALDDLFAELNAHRDVVYISADAAARLFADLDTSGDGSLHRDEFERVVDVLQGEADRKKAGLSDDELPSAPWRARARRLVEAASFELGVDALLLLNAALIAYQTKDELLGTAASDASDVRGVLEALESGFAVLYVAEASLKVAGLGLTQYAANYRNRFDGLVTLASLAAAAYVAYPNAYDNPALVRYVVMLRLLRLVRLIVALPEFQVIGISFLNMLPAASRLVQVLFCVTFFFATLGAALFQGLINADPGAPQLAKLEGTDFYAQGYLPLNFNDYESGFVTLFCVLVVNNWFVLVEGFVAVSDEWTGRAFFLAFYLVGVLVLLNVVVAFILDAFISELDKTRSLRRAASR